MLDLVTTARLEDVIKADDIRLDVDVGMVDAVPDACLRREIHDDVGLILFKNLRHQRLVGKIPSDKGVFILGFDPVKLAEAVFFQGNVVIVVHAVKADDRRAVEFQKQPLGKEKTDKPRGTRHKYRFAVQFNVSFDHLLIPRYSFFTCS